MTIIYVCLRADMAEAPLLPPGWAEGAERYRIPLQRHVSSVCRGLCLSAATELLGYAPRLSAAPDGRPYIEGDPVYISMTHSGSACAAMVSHSPCGIDMERIGDSRRCVPLSERYFAPEEALHIRSCADPRRDFALLWTAKESLKKQSGMPLTEALAASGIAARSRSYTVGAEEYILSYICREGAEPILKDEVITS